MMATRGRFITLEGIEGAGKSSVARALLQHLQATGQPVIASREPGGTPMAERIRELVLTRSEEPLPAGGELLLMFAARAVHVSNLLEPALARGDWVLCDRFTDATLAYQGGGRGVPLDDILSLTQFAHPGLSPDLTLLLDVPPAIGLQRARGRGENGDRFEDETVAFFDRVRAVYLQLARAQPQRWCVIDATAPLQQVLEQAKAAVQALQGTS
ncbi:MAG: dTMP kinase [Proteobacteria bacterium]|jgi:dTMP kinase|nr:dTMP kinase [Pseudomonadota bacterium]